MTLSTSIRGAIVILGLIFSLAPMAAAEDWFQWRGPNVDGISTESGWNAAQPRKAWEAQLGVGCSSVSVSGGRLYSMGWNNNKDTLYCFDAKTGRKIWQLTYRADRWDQLHDGGPGTTPAVINGNVYIVSRAGELRCVNAENGREIWKKDLSREARVRAPKFGFTGSAVTDGDTIFVDFGVIIALESDGSDQVKWQTRDYGPAYSTPMPFKIGQREAVAAFAKSGLVLLNRQDGSQLVSHQWHTKYGINAATPVIGDNQVFISSGYNTGCVMLAIKNRGLSEMWGGREMRNHMASCIYLDGYIYGFDEAVFKCLDAKTGRQMWNQRGLGKGALMVADGKLIVLSERGKLIIAEASPRGFNQISAVNAVSGKTWVTPVLANKRIYAKNNGGHLVCFDVSQ